MSKRGFVAFENASPDLNTLKRRRMTDGTPVLFGHGVINPNGLGAQQQLALQHQKQLVLQQQQQQQLQLQQLQQQGKRRRSGSGDCAVVHQGGEAGQLRIELKSVQAAATAKINQLELVGNNLRHTCEEQASELGQMHKENKLLKRSVLVLNERREEAERVAAEVKRAAEQLARRVAELECANMKLCMRQHNGVSASPCRQDGWNGGSGGNGHVF